MTANPIVSVVIPHLPEGRQAPYRPSIGSFADVSNIEAIVANDNVPGSEWDIATKKLIEQFQADDARVKHVHTSGKTGGGGSTQPCLPRSLRQVLRVP